MLCLHVKNIHKSFTDAPLLQGVDFTILKGQKVALVAKNGAGKSTLIKIIQGECEPSQGSIHFHKNITKGFLAQRFDAPDDMSVYDAIYTYNNPLGQLLRDYERMVANPAGSVNDQDALHDMLHAIEQQHGRDFDSKVQTIMSKLQLTSFADATMGSLSGGEAKRVALARALIDEPDFLVLDEPTNHLDVEMIERLEKYLKKTSMTLLMVTHDRYFLERVCTDIYELDRGVIHTYKGNYAYFLEKKAEREEREQLQVHKLKQLYKRELERMRKAPRARETKAVDRQKDFYDLQSQYKTSQQRLNEQATKLEFSVHKRRLGDKVLKIHNLQKSFGEKVILRGFSHDFKQGERVGIIGKNGAGKSTFMNMLAQLEPYDSGSMVRGKTVTIGYYRQQYTLPTTNKTIIEYVKSIADRVVVGKGKILSATKLLERFLFSPKKQQQRVDGLSGGEKKRLQLLLVLIQNPNFLILDEPTNDLDLMTLGVLEDFLLAYEGVLVIISHDRFFMDKLVDHIFVFEGDGDVSDFWGTYTEYKHQQKLDNSKAKQKSRQNAKDKQKDKQSKQDGVDAGETSQQSVTFSTPPKKLSYNEQREFEQLNTDIHDLEQRKHEINCLFQQGDMDHASIKELGKELNILLAQLIQKEERWMELADRV